VDQQRQLAEPDGGDMKLKRFIAQDMTSALERVKKELGPDAVIISTEKRRIKQHGRPGFKSIIEVVAAVDPAETEIAPDTNQAAWLKNRKQENSADKAPDGMLAELKREIAELKEILEYKGMIEMTTLPKGIGDSLLYGSPAIAVDNFLTSLNLDTATKQFLYPRIFRTLESTPVTESALNEWLYNFLKSNMKRGGQAEHWAKPCWWAFIGPTGVGKTTTLAKIAARLKFIHRRHGVLVSVDSYRLGAAEQLRKYAALMDLPFETASTNTELLKIFGDYADYDFILVDTTGRNPFSDRHQRELQRLFDTIPELMAQVMLCSSYDIRQIVKTIEFYKRFPVAGYTLTKTDEIESAAAPLIALAARQLPISYITNGQRVPEDIKSATIELCIDMISGRAAAPILSGRTQQNVTHATC